MIKFFKKIRQNLLKENKTGKYLKYAIGEIVLVVIGILIALQINNWNEVNKDRAREEKILIALQTEMVAAKEDIKHFRGARKYHEAKLRDYLMTIMDSTLSLQQKAAIPIPGIYDAEIKYIPNYLNSIIYSGDIDLISNDSLKAELTSWQTLLTNLKEGTMNSDEFFDYLNERMPESLVDDNNFEGWTVTQLYSEEELSTYRMRFVNDYYFHNVIKRFIRKHYVRRGTLKHALNRTELIQEIITQELKKIE
jgi:hypothetical protein